MADSEKLLGGTLDYSPAPSKGIKDRVMAMSISNASAREWFSKAREGVKPWAEFFNSKRFAVPKSVAPLPKRVVKNVEAFQGNYLFVFMALVVVCVLTSPFLLIAIATCLGACYIISIKNQEKKISIMGRELSLAQQYAGVGLCSFPLFWLVGAGSAIFWIIGASFCAIMFHASFFKTQEEMEGFDIELEEVQSV